MKKTLLTVVATLLLPVFAQAATYDDLISSAKLGDTREVAALTGKGASIDSTDIDGNTLLMLAARDGHAELVDFLIKQRAKLNARNASGDTALRLAAYFGHRKVVRTPPGAAAPPCRATTQPAWPALTPGPVSRPGRLLLPQQWQA